MARNRKPLSDRFAAKTRRDPVTGCLLWTAALNSKGYGRIYNEVGRVELAHRVAWRLSGRPLIPGLELDHVKERCSSVLCVEVEHLEQVTHAENVSRGNAPSAISHRLSVCRRGHQMTPEHGSRKSGKWQCNTCRREGRPSMTKPTDPAFCPGCNVGPLPQPRVGRRRVWCSRSCREKTP